MCWLCVLTISSNIKTIFKFIVQPQIVQTEEIHIKLSTSSSFLSEFLAEESQEKFWDFVEANQNIEGEHDGIVNCLSHFGPAITFVSVYQAVEFVIFLCVCMQLQSWSFVKASCKPLCNRTELQHVMLICSFHPCDTVRNVIWVKEWKRSISKLLLFVLIVLMQTQIRPTMTWLLRKPVPCSAPSRWTC